MLPGDELIAEDLSLECRVLIDMIHSCKSNAPEHRDVELLSLSGTMASEMSTKSGFDTTTRPLIPLTIENEGRATLRVAYPEEMDVEIPLSRTRTVIGRQPQEENIPAVEDETVSRQHFVATWNLQKQCHEGLDLSSRNGSRIDGVAVGSEPRVLRDGTVVRIGDVLLVYEDKHPNDAESSEASSDAIPGRAEAARVLRQAVFRAAPDPSPVLLTGETGTGKEYVVSEIHRLSGRHGTRVAVNCAALSPQLIESQLFGHVQGAFTGATKSQPGLFRASDGGTLFLDEIGELPLELQPKLLRAIQTGEIRPLGGTQTIDVDVRIVAATNRDLAALSESGGFRRDLFARLSLWGIHVPSVRERLSDFFLWVKRLHEDWLHKRGRTGEPRLRFHADAAETLLLCPWRDNLRGIDRLVHEMAGKGSQDLILLSHLPQWLVTPSTAAPKRRSRRPAPNAEELDAILTQLDGSVRAAAKHFDRDRRQIYRWLEKYGLTEKWRAKDSTAEE